MSDYIIQDSILSGIANAIREKNGNSLDTYYPSEMAAAIQNLPTTSIPIISSQDWAALTTEEKQAYGLVIVQEATSGYERGIYVNGADYIPS